MLSGETPTPVPFAFRRPGRSIRLYRGAIELRSDGALLAGGSGEVSFSWTPTPGLQFSLADSGVDTLIERQDNSLAIPSLGVEASVLLTNWSVGGGEIRGVINRAPFPATSAIRELRFALANYLFTHRGDPLHEERGGRETVWSGRVVLQTDEWQLTVDARSDRTTVTERLRTVGGFEITHTAQLARADGSPFDDTAATQMLLILAHFFGFTNGRWAPPMLAHGYDASGRIVWRDWSPATFSRWRGARNVIDPFHPEALQEIFVGYLQRWQDPVWRDALLFGTQMYVEANGPVFAETSLVLSQAALELLAWVRIVEDSKGVTAQDFNKLKHGAAARIRALFKWLGLDPAIPSELGALTAEAARMGWVDGPHAIDALRNALIHPSKRARIEDTDLTARIQAHELALWYVELAILRAVGFDGSYSSRLRSTTTGEVFAVPWQQMVARDRRTDPVESETG